MSNTSLKQDARQFAIDGEMACLPKGCPIPFTVISARFTKKNVVLAHVRMFDGLPGTLRVSRVMCGGYSTWEIYWPDLSGGAINWNGNYWERCLHVEQVEQLALPLG